MSRVEITHNRGPEVFHTINSNIAAGVKDYYSEIKDVRLYTLHSYQVLSESSDVDFTILASNVILPDVKPSLNFQRDWTVISNHLVSGDIPLAYSDIWNFNFSCVLIKNLSSSASQVNVLEKHNA